MENDKKCPKRVILQVSNEEHAQWKNRATFRGMTLSGWIRRAVFEQIQKEKQYE